MSRSLRDLGRSAKPKCTNTAGVGSYLGRRVGLHDQGSTGIKGKTTGTRVCSCNVRRAGVPAIHSSANDLRKFGFTKVST
jgi:hypothetical protein